VITAFGDEPLDVKTPSRIKTPLVHEVGLKNNHVAAFGLAEMIRQPIHKNVVAARLAYTVGRPYSQETPPQEVEHALRQARVRVRRPLAAEQNIRPARDERPVHIVIRVYENAVECR